MVAVQRVRRLLEKLYNFLEIYFIKREKESLKLQCTIVLIKSPTVVINSQRKKKCDGLRKRDKW